MSFRPHIFGRYTILDPIAVGGMAEIYRARLTNTGDAPDRIIIIKKIIQSLSNNPDFVDMFEAEIKITVGLSHPNIVQIFDYGRVEGLSFLAMEYVEGKNLRQFLKRLIGMKSMFSIDMSCHIISQVCNAMSYAHAFKDRMTGEHLGLVHRDVSPQNVMISYDGAVKLFDFGIAKAKSASEATQAGVIKGKPSYLSPEQIASEVLDGRSDIFSLGIVLWEMLTAKRLFVADNDMAILRMIQSAKIETPSTYNPAIPQALDAIVMKSLARDRDKRYRTAEEMQRDLHRFLYSYNPSFNPADLSYYATELFKKEIQEDRDRLRTALKISPDPMPNYGQKAPAAEGSAAVQPTAVPTTAMPATGQNPAPAKGEHKTSTKTGQTEGLLSSNDFNREVMEDMLMTKTEQKFNNEIELEIPQIDKPAPKPAAASPAPAPASKTERKLDSGKTPPVAPAKARLTAPSVKTGTPTPGKVVAAPKSKQDDMVIPPWSANEGTDASTSRRVTITSLNDAVIDRKKMRAGSRSILLDRELNGNGSGSRTGYLVALLGIVVVGFLASIRMAPEMMGPVVEGTPLVLFMSDADRIPASRQVVVVPATKKKVVVVDSGASAEAPTAPGEPKAPAPAPGHQSGEIHEVNFAKVKIRSSLPDLTVTIDSRPAKLLQGTLAVPIGAEVNIEFSAPGYDSKVVTTKLTSAEEREWPIELQKVENGRLTFVTRPGADITLKSAGRRPLSLYTPLKNYELPTGEYEAVIENQRIGHKSTLKFTIEKGKVTTVEKELM